MIEYPPTHESIEDLTAYIQQVVDGPPEGHDYNTSGYAMAQAAVAAFNFVASRLGVTGFQASYAALAAYGEVTGTKGPFGVIRGDDALYPQYDLEAKVTQWIEEWGPWLGAQAREKLASSTHAVAPVKEHWQRLAEAWPEGEES